MLGGMTASVVAPAPGELEMVRQFVNTRDVEEGTDTFATPDDLTRWLRDASVLGSGRGTRADADQFAAAVALREALREAMAANHDGAPPPPPAVGVINRVAERAQLRLQLDEDGGWRARPRASGVDGALGALVALVWTAMSDGSWRRLKVCVHEACQWSFYDESKTRSAKWCSMKVCGNRAKQQAWRERRTRS